MITHDNELRVLEEFRELSTKYIDRIGNFLKCEYIHNSLTGVLNRNKWKNSFGKSDPPPDFYNDKHKLMMEMMFVEDNSYKNKKGKLVNKTKERENIILKTIFGSNYKNERDDLNVTVVTSSGLPSLEDHNFNRYFDNFKRVFDKHVKKLGDYNKNHPGYKSIFFIFDGSTAYVEHLDGLPLEPKPGQLLAGRPHIFTRDRRFVNIIKNSGVDYVIWYAPWKAILKPGGGVYDFPRCAIYDVKNIKEKDLFDYDPKFVISSEK